MTGEDIDISKMEQQISTADGIMLFLELANETLFNDGLIRYPDEMASFSGGNDCEMFYGATSARDAGPERVVCIFRGK